MKFRIVKKPYDGKLMYFAEVKYSGWFFGLFWRSCFYRYRVYNPEIAPPAASYDSEREAMEAIETWKAEKALEATPPQIIAVTQEDNDAK